MTDNIDDYNLHVIKYSNQSLIIKFSLETSI